MVCSLCSGISTSICFNFYFHPSTHSIFRGVSGKNWKAWLSQKSPISFYSQLCESLLLFWFYGLFLFINSITSLFLIICYIFGKLVHALKLTKLPSLFFMKVEFHSPVVKDFLENKGKLYRSVKTIDFGDKIDKAEARELAVLVPKQNRWPGIRSLVHIIFLLQPSPPTTVREKAWI